MDLKELECQRKAVAKEFRQKKSPLRKEISQMTKALAEQRKQLKELDVQAREEQRYFQWLEWLLNFNHWFEKTGTTLTMRSEKYQIEHINIYNNNKSAQEVDVLIFTVTHKDETQHITLPILQTNLSQTNIRVLTKTPANWGVISSKWCNEHFGTPEDLIALQDLLNGDFSNQAYCLAGCSFTIKHGDFNLLKEAIESSRYSWGVNTITAKVWANFEKELLHFRSTQEEVEPPKRLRL